MSTHLNIKDSIITQSYDIQSEVEWCELDFRTSIEEDSTYSDDDILDILNNTDGYDILFGDKAEYYETIVQMAELFCIVDNKHGDINSRETFANELKQMLTDWSDYWFFRSQELREHIKSVESEITNMLTQRLPHKF